MSRVKKIIYLIWYIVIMLIASSCTIQGSFKGLFSDYKKTKSERPDLFRVKEYEAQRYCRANSYIPSSVLLTTGNNLKQCLSSCNKAIIYLWSPYCKSEVCYQLNVFQQTLDKKGITLFVVAEYYDSKLMAKEYQLDRPIFGIDVKYYKSNLTSRYTSKFLSDLTKDKIKGANGRLIYFKNGEYKGTFTDLFEI